MATTLLLLRHGETEWSRTGRHTGRTDVPLTAEGRRQARALGSRVAGRDLAAVWTSPLGRAVQTAELAGLGERAEPDPDLAEWDYGDYEGISTPEVRRGRPGWSLFADGVPHGESAANVGARADRVLARAGAVDGVVVLVAHGHLLRVLTARWLGLPPEAGRLFALDTATYGELGHEREQAVVRVWNDASHLT